MTMDGATGDLRRWAYALANGLGFSAERVDATQELVALSACTCEVMWLRNFLYELGLGAVAATPIYCDNTAAKAVAENPVASRQLRHVARRHFFVQDAVRAGAVTVPYVASDANLLVVLQLMRIQADGSQRATLVELNTGQSTELSGITLAPVPCRVVLAATAASSSRK